MIAWQKYLLYGLAALTLLALIVVGVRGCQQDERNENNQLVNSGVIVERQKGNEEVINHVEEATAARDRPTSDERNVVCSKYDRNCGSNGQ